MSEPVKRVRRRWKKCETDVADRLGGRRVPITGRQCGDVPDVEHEWLSIEVKSRKVIPAWLHDAMAQAVAAKDAREADDELNAIMTSVEAYYAERHEYLPIVVLHEKSRRHDDDFVVVRLKDFVEWFGGDDHERCP